MSPDDKLSWIKSLKQWRKRYCGKTYYLGTGKGKTDRESHQRALSKWHQIKADVANETKRELAKKRLQHMRDAYADLRDQLAARPGIEPNPYAGRTAIDSDEPLQIPLERLLDPSRYHTVPNFPPSSDTTNSKRVVAHLDEYIEEQRRRYEHGSKFPDAPRRDRISAARFIAYQYNVDLLKAAWHDKLMPNTEAGVATMLRNLRNTQSRLLTAGTIKPNTFNERIKTLRHFVGWLHDNYYIDALPRKLSELCAKYNYETSAKALDLDVIHRLWDDGDDRFKTFMALALNCGYYASDIAHLEHSHILPNHIINDRHKTGVPVRYKLWATTKQLLGKCCNGPDRHAFVAKNGGLLLQNDTSKRTRFCEIDNDLRARCKRLKIRGVSFSNFRDTSSTRVESFDRTLTDLFDGHKDTRMAARYIDGGKVDYDRMYAQLDLAIDELESYYGLTLSK